MSSSSTLPLRVSITLFAALFALLAFACTAKSGATKAPPTRCTAGNYVFCRCADREEGTKLCNEDGETFGKCEPCESDSNPELPEDEDPNPRPPLDAGPDSQIKGKCGDKNVTDGEDCDDGNAVNDDGCDDTCHLSGVNPLATRSCPGLDVHVWSKPVTYIGTTVGSTNTGTASPTCGSATGDIPTTGAAASDRVFRVTAHKTGNMTVATTDVDYNSFLYVSDTCASGNNTWLKCANKADIGGGETMTFPVEAGKAYTVFVDGAGISGQQGSFRVTFSIP